MTLGRAKQMMAVIDAREGSPEELRRFMTSPEGKAVAAAHGWHFEEVAPDVFVDSEVFEGALIVEMIQSTDPRSGKVGRWLDSLVDRDVVVMAVISDRLEGMLRRRGFTCVHRHGGHWARPARGD